MKTAAAERHRRRGRPQRVRAGIFGAGVNESALDDPAVMTARDPPAIW
jgi:hypothetical protein